MCLTCQFQYLLVGLPVDVYVAYTLEETACRGSLLGGVRPLRRSREKGGGSRRSAYLDECSSVHILAVFFSKAKMRELFRIPVTKSMGNITIFTYHLLFAWHKGV